MASGTNRLILSENVEKSESALTSALENANEEALKINAPVSKK